MSVWLILAAVIVGLALVLVGLIAFMRAVADMVDLDDDHCHTFIGRDQYGTERRAALVEQQRRAR